MTRHATASLVFVLLVFVGATAAAQSNVDQAQQHFEKGANLYFVGEYEKAIAEFEKANALTPDPIILYNISLAHQKLGNEDAALAVARLASTMGGFAKEDGLRNESRIVALQSVLEAREVADASAPSVPAPEADPIERVDASVEEEAEPQTGGDQGPPLGWGTWKWVGAGVAGGGVVMLGIAGIFELRLNRSIDEYEEAAATGDKKNFDFVGQRLRRQQNVGRAFLYTGLVLVAGGVTLWVLNHRGIFRGTESALLVGPGEVGLRVTF